MGVKESLSFLDESQVKSNKFYVPKFFYSEIIATFVYCFYTQLFNVPENVSIWGPFCTGLLVYIIIITTHTMAIVHFNPAVTVAFQLSNKITLVESGWYYLAQFVGGYLGSLTATCCLVGSGSDSAAALAKMTLNVNPDAATPMVFTSEIITTSILCLIATQACYNGKTWKDQTAPFAIGLSVFVGIVAGSGIQAGCLNPVRSMAPYAAHPGQWFQMVWDNLAFIAGPLLGGVLSALLYRVFYDEKELSKETVLPRLGSIRKQ